MTCGLKDEVVAEIRTLIESLECTTELKSDHVLNLLPEVEGELPQDKERMLATIDRYLALPPDERINFRLGRRAGYYTGLDKLQDAVKHEKVEQAIKRIESEDHDGVEKAICALKSRFI